MTEYTPLRLLRDFKFSGTYSTQLRHFKCQSLATPKLLNSLSRIEQAKIKLVETEDSVTRICFDLDYRSLGTFSRIFKNYVGLSPLSFRTWARTFRLDELMCDYLSGKKSIDKYMYTTDYQTTALKQNIFKKTYFIFYLYKMLIIS